MAITTHAAGRGLPPLPLAALMAIGLLGSTVSSNAEDGPRHYQANRFCTLQSKRARVQRASGFGQSVGVRAG